MGNEVKELFLQSIRQRIESNTIPLAGSFSPEQVMNAIKALEYCANDIETAAQELVLNKRIASLNDARSVVHLVHDYFPFERHAFHWLDSLEDVAKIYSIDFDFLCKAN